MTNVFVLGAGTSAFHGASGAPHPPMADQFFCLPESEALLSDYRELASYLSLLLGYDTVARRKLDIEDVFRRAEAPWRFNVHKTDKNVVRLGQSFQYVSPLDMLHSYVVDLLMLTTSWASERTCPTHDRLVRSFLHPGDAIISFNYDLLVDASLGSSGQWNETTGYGFYDPSTPQREESTILLLKPHGSLNWYREKRRQDALAGDLPPKEVDSIAVLPILDAARGQTAKVRKDGTVTNSAINAAKSFKYLDESLDDSDLVHLDIKRQFMGKPLGELGYYPLLAMPTPYKSFDELCFGQLADVWRQVSTVLSQCERVFACGFSFRDEEFNSLIDQAAMTRETALPLCIITERPADKENLLRRFSLPRVQLEHHHGWLADFLAHPAWERLR